jgi:hypothetical protein
LRFTVRRPPIGEVSPCSHRPSGGDVTCGIDVGVAPASSAGLALENRLALTVPRSDMPAHRATLRRKRGRNLLDPTISLVLQPRGQTPPTTAADRSVQATLLSNPDTGPLNRPSRSAGHRPDVKGFDPDRVKAARNISADLFDPVLTPVRLTRSQLCDRPFGCCSPVGAALGPREPLLQHLQPLSLTAGQNRCAQQLARRQRRRDRNTTVDAHHTPIVRPRNRSGNVGEGDMPAAAPIPGDPVGLDARWHLPRPAVPHPAHLGHPHPTEPTVQTHNVMRLQRDLPKPFMQTGLAPRRPTMRPGEKVLHRLCEIPQRLLLHRLTSRTKPRVFATGLGQLRALLDIAGSPAARLPVPLLLHRQIPHKPRVTAMLDQPHLLFGGRKQSVSRHPVNVTAVTDKSPKGEAALRPPAEVRAFQAANIQ